MKNTHGRKSLLFQTEDDSKLIFVRLIVGLIFISEGIQKFTIISTLGPLFFRDIGFNNPVFWAHFTGTFEITCGTLVLFGLLTRIVTIPLLVIMIVAFITTKYPLLITRGFMTFAHEYRTEFSVTMLLIILMIYGGGKWSVDSEIQRIGKA
jgi:putative oxidoreductase